MAEGIAEWRAGRALELMAWPLGDSASGNPYQPLVYRELERLGWRVEDFSPGRLLRRPPALVHIHWPDLVLEERRPAVRFLKTIAFLALFALTRVRGSQLVWTVHNPDLRPEVRTRWGRVYLRELTRLSSGLIFLSARHLGRLRPSGRPAAVIPQPSYRGCYGEARRQEEARRRLGLRADQKVLGFFGSVRPYKGLGALLRAFHDIGDPDVRLLVAGTFDERCAELAVEARRNPRIVLLDRHVPRDEVAFVLAALDVLVLPYRELGNSAVAMLALSYDRPLLASSRADSVAELRDAVGDAWIRLYEGELSDRDLRDVLARPPLTGAEPDLSGFAPERVGALHDSFFRALLAGEAR
jgi:beta-1,4-mannosyltransferase